MKNKTVSNVREIRTVAGELQSVAEGGKNYLTGYAALYNVRSSNLGWGMYEVIMPGAFKRALAESQDVRHLVNHDPSLLLGRTKAGTTILTEDNKGLQFKTLLPDTQLARDLTVSIQRGDINECSFGFVCRKATWVEEVDATNAGNVNDIRHVEDCDLFDISTVTFPAYPQTNTSLAMRAMFPEGVPTEIRLKRRFGTPDADVDDTVGCACPCPYCEQDRCEFCCNEYCREEDCLHAYPSNHDSLRTGKTKKTDGESLTAEDFLIVGAADDPDTWKLPVHFSTEEKTVSHIKNALARFDQVQDVAADVKKAAWDRLVALAEEHDITVSDEDKEKHRSLLPAPLADIALQNAQIVLANAELKMRALRASLD